MRPPGPKRPRPEGRSAALVLAHAMTEPHLTVLPPGPVRTCIVTGEEAAPERMIRFVVGPQGDVVPDLARRLPGRGMWVKAERAVLEQAVTRSLFSKAAPAAAQAPAALPERVERLLLGRTLGGLCRAPRAGPPGS